MPSLSAVERGRLVAQLRLSKEQDLSPRNPDESFIIEPVTPELFPSPVQAALQSEIETLQCILRAKEREMEVLRSQLAESNRIIEKTREMISKENTSQPSSSAAKLLNSFSEASVGSLQRVLGAIETRTKATDLFTLQKRVEELADFETKYDQIYRVVCLYLRLRPGDLSHASLIHLLKSQGKQTIVDEDKTVLKDATKKATGISWTFR